MASVTLSSGSFHSLDQRAEPTHARRAAELLLTIVAAPILVAVYIMAVTLLKIANRGHA